MKWTDAGGGSDYAPAPAGNHLGICVKIVDLGTRRKEFNGEARLKREVIIGWELPNELMSEGEFAGKPFIVTKFYTQSLHEKATLRGDLESWRGRTFTASELQGFDAKNILGKPCMVNVIHDKGKAKVSNVSPVAKGMTVPKQMTPSVYFSLDDFDQAVFDGLTEGLKRMIVESPEYKQLANGNQGQGDWKPGDEPIDDEDRVPF